MTFKSYYGEEGGSEIFDALDLIATHPLIGLFRVIGEIQRESDGVMEHLARHLLVHALVENSVFLEVAESISKKLVEDDPDASHLKLLASVFEKQGRLSEAAEARERSATSKDSHYDPKYDAFVKEMAAKLSK